MKKVISALLLFTCISTAQEHEGQIVGKILDAKTELEHQRVSDDYQCAEQEERVFQQLSE